MYLILKRSHKVCILRWAKLTFLQCHRSLNHFHALPCGCFLHVLGTRVKVSKSPVKEKPWIYTRHIQLINLAKNNFKFKNYCNKGLIPCVLSNGRTKTEVTNKKNSYVICNVSIEEQFIFCIEKNKGNSLRGE